MKKLNLIPLGYRILVKPADIKEEVDLGNGKKLEIVKADEKLHRASMDRGEVIAVGDEVNLAYRKIDDNGIERNGQPWVKVGDKIWFTRNAGYHIVHPETKERFIVLNDGDPIVKLQEVEE